MSYGVMASKAAQVQVEYAAPLGPIDDAGSRDTSRSDRVSPWTSGRVILTSRHLSFSPTSASAGALGLSIALADVIAIETSGRLHPTVTFRTAALALRVRVAGAAAFYRRASTSVETNRKRGTVQVGLDDSGLDDSALGDSGLDQSEDDETRQGPPVSSAS